MFQLLAGILGMATIVIPATASETTRPLDLSARLSHPVVDPGTAQTLHLRIGLLGRPVAQREARAPLNIALVIDRSGSMQGPRIEAARQAARMAIERLTPRDIVSVVSYDDRVEVEVPATRATDPRSMQDKVSRLTARGSTAIWAGMQRGADEIRKFKSRTYINKIILLSDGLANVGPSQPSDFARLGRGLASEGISVSTIGLGTGYNEDLMAKLAMNADGTHKFVAEPADLAQFFAREFDDAQSVVAQEIIIEIDCGPGIRPRRSLGREAEIRGNRMSYRVGMAYANVEQTALVELDLDPMTPGSQRIVANMTVTYLGLDGTTKHRQTAQIVARAALAPGEAEGNIDRAVIRDVTLLTAREQKEEALRLRDAGRIDEAQQKFKDNAGYIGSAAQRFGFSDDAEIARQKTAADQAAAPSAASSSEWEKVRKTLRETDTNQAGAKTRY